MREERITFTGAPISTRTHTVTAMYWFGVLLLGLLAAAALIIAAIALHDSLNESSSDTPSVQCNGTCTYCLDNGTDVLPWGGRSEQQFSTNTLGVGPLFAPLNTANYTPFNICSVASGAVGSDSADTTPMRRRRFAPSDAVDFSWRTQRIPPPGYVVGDGALPASMEVDGSMFIIGNLTATCGAYVGCETLSPVGNFTVLYTYNTSGQVYFQVYPALELLRSGLGNLTIVVDGLNGTSLAQNVSNITQQVNLLWAAVDNLTIVVDNNTAVLANISTTLVQLVNETDTLSDYVYNVLNVTVSQLETNLTLASVVANAALACCTTTNTTINALVTNVTALQAEMVVVDAEIASLQGNVTLLQQQVAVLQGNATTIQNEIVILQTNVSSIAGELTVLQSNITALDNITSVLAQQLTNLTACCNASSNVSTPVTVGVIINATANGVVIDSTNQTVHLAVSDSTTRGVTYGFVSGLAVPLNTFVGYRTPSASSTTMSSSGIGYEALLSVTSGTSDVALGYHALPNLTTAVNMVGVGVNSGMGVNDGASCVYVGTNAAASSSSLTQEYVFGSWRSPTPLVGSGSQSYTLDVVAVPTGGDPTLQIAPDGVLTRTASSIIYKNPLPPPPVADFVQYLSQLTPRAFTFKTDPTNRTRLGYYAEEVMAIVNSDGAPVFQPWLNYRKEDDLTQSPQSMTTWVVDPVTHAIVQQMVDVYPKKDVVSGIDYPGLMVPLVAHAKWLAARLTQLEQLASLAPPAMA